jgi:transposase-like protein
MVRNSLNFVSWKECKEVAADLRVVYTAATVEQASAALDAFALRWDPHYPQIAKSWRNNWARVIPLSAYVPEIRKVIYAAQEVPLGDTTNAVESVNFSCRKLTKARASFPND